MTLLEVLIVLFFVQVLLLSCYAMYNLSVGFWDGSVRSTRSNARLRRVADRLHQDIWAAGAASVEVRPLEQQICFERSGARLCYYEYRSAGRASIRLANRTTGDDPSRGEGEVIASGVGLEVLSSPLTVNAVARTEGAWLPVSAYPRF